MKPSPIAVGEEAAGGVAKESLVMPKSASSSNGTASLPFPDNPVLNAQIKSCYYCTLIIVKL